MKTVENMENLVGNFCKRQKSSVKTSTEMDKRILDDAIMAYEQSKKTEPAELKPGGWGIIKVSRIAKLAAAAMIIITIGLSIKFLDKFVSHAYAIEQTIEASKNLRHLYFEYFSDSENEPSKECWVTFDNAGQPKKVRVNMYKHWGDTQITQIWENGQTKYWRKDENTMEIFKCEVQTAKILKLVNECDPRTAVTSLYEREQKGEVRIEIEEPRDRKKPIVIKGTFKPGKYLIENPTLPSFQDILYVNQATKLVSAIEIYELKGEEYKYNGVWKYPDCSEYFDDEIFYLENEIPSDVMQIIHYTGADVNNQGLEQGAYSEEQAAFIVVQEFFNALISGDYTKAGRLFGGMPRGEAEKKFRDLHVISVISIGEPVKSEKPSSFRVPCIIEVEKNGEIVEWQPDGPYVRQVYRHAGRWRIIGGI